MYYYNFCYIINQYYNFYQHVTTSDNRQEHGSRQAQLGNMQGVGQGARQQGARQPARWKKGVYMYSLPGSEPTLLQHTFT